MEGSHYQEWEKYPYFPLADAVAADDGVYVVHSNDHKSVEAKGPDIQSRLWFRSPPLDTTTIKRINRIQLHTKSHDQGFCTDPEAGTWTWFEIAIMKDERAESPRIKDGIKLTWESHVNIQGRSDSEELTGREFKIGDDILGSLEEGNVLAVHICAQFSKWALYAEEGFLAIGLGPATGHTPVSFGDLVSRTKTFQQAIIDMNEVLHPGMEHRRLPAAVFDASRIDTNEKRQLRVLVLDGGGVRGLAALHILHKIMIEAHGDEYEANDIKPCDVFDMICGTSTGGLIAIMLGRMEMKVSDCIKEYEAFMDKVFPRGILGNKLLNDIPGVGYLLSGIGWARETVSEVWKGEKWESDELEDSIKTVMRKYMKQQGKPVDPEKVLLRNADKAACKVFVTATRKEGGTNSPPVLLRSYVNQCPDGTDELPEIKVWEAARATSAAPLYFKHITVGKYTLVDGGLQANNPLGWAWNEVLTTFGPARTTSCFLSIGTGYAKAKVLPTIGLNWDLLKIKAAFLDALSAFTTNTELTNVLFRSLINNFSPKSGNKKYWRFNVGDGWVDLVKKNDSWIWAADSNVKAVDIALDDSGKKREIADEAIAYMNAQGPIQLQKIKDCAAALLAPDLEDIPTSLPTPPPDKTTFEEGPR